MTLTSRRTFLTTVVGVIGAALGGAALSRFTPQPVYVLPECVYVTTSGWKHDPTYGEWAQYEERWIKRGEYEWECLYVLHGSERTLVTCTTHQRPPFALVRHS